MPSPPPPPPANKPPAPPDPPPPERDEVNRWSRSFASNLRATISAALPLGDRIRGIEPATREGRET